jgi:hippurate hydrolase
MGISDSIQRLAPEMAEWRHVLHSYPETAFQENRTSDLIASRLSEFGIDIRRGIAGTGVVGILKKGDSPKSIGLRADMDALDITEENSFPYRSKNKGKMHACGHDGHMAMLLGAAKYLSEEGYFDGTVYFIFQPAEENEGGANAMVRDGLFDLFPMEAIYGMHAFPILPFGTFSLRPGPIMAGCDKFDIIIKGSGGHAAMPHLVKDPVVSASHLIGMIQSIVSRSIDPVESAVVSITGMQSGRTTTYNIIPEQVTLQGTVRYFDTKVQDTVEKRLREIAAGIAISMGTKIEVKYERCYPPLINSVPETNHAIEAASQVVGRENVFRDFKPTLGSEDFAFLLQKKPGAYVFLGSGDPDPNGSLHQSGYDFNDALLPIGASYWASLVELLL